VRVLLVRLDGVGDAAVCTPLIAALRAAGHAVGVALTTRNAGLFAPTAVEAEHVLERIAWPAHGSTPESTALARAQIAEQGYDVALVASEEPEAYALARGIPQRIGFTTGWMRPLKNLWVRREVTSAVTRSQRVRSGAAAHEVEVMFRLGTTLVADAAPSVDTEELRPMLRANPQPAREDGAIVLQAGAKWASIGVPQTALRELVTALGSRRLRVIAAPAERDAAQAQLGVPVETFAELRDWVAALDTAAAVITPDSGAAHVAGMLGVPVVDVFPDAHFAAQCARWRPWASPSAQYPASTFGGAPAKITEAALHAF
jgi:ADP-heptose:LPS heptosyltransferase